MEVDSSRALRNRLARHLRLLRCWHGWSQEQLAHCCGLHRTYIGAIERGEQNITLDTLQKIATALDVSAASLLAADSPHYPAPLPDDSGIREAPGIYGRGAPHPASHCIRPLPAAVPHWLA